MLTKEEVKEHARANNRQYYANNKEKVLAAHKTYCQKNKDKMAAYAKKYREEHAEEIVAKNKEYRSKSRKKTNRIKSTKKGAVVGRGKKYCDQVMSSIVIMDEHIVEEDRYGAGTFWGE